MSKTLLLQSSGNLIDLARMDVDDIQTQDIVTCLKNQYRFHGAMRWSVAAHSAYCYELAQRDVVKGGADNAKFALIHDCHEAYTGDIISPMKAAAGIHDQVARVQSGIDTIIEKAFDMIEKTQAIVDIVKSIDRIALNMELRYLFQESLKFNGNKEDYTLAFFRRVYGESFCPFYFEELEERGVKLNLHFECRNAQYESSFEHEMFEMSASSNNYTGG